MVVREAPARVHAPSATRYSDMKGLAEHGYEDAPDWRFSCELSLWKAPALPLKPCQTTSSLDGKAYVGVGQADGALHTLLVLQAYQTDLLMDLDLDEGLSPSNLGGQGLSDGRAPACAVDRSIAAMLTKERHLRLNL